MLKLNDMQKQSALAAELRQQLTVVLAQYLQRSGRMQDMNSVDRDMVLTTHLRGQIAAVSSILKALEVGSQDPAYSEVSSEPSQ